MMRKAGILVGVIVVAFLAYRHFGPRRTADLMPHQPAQPAATAVSSALPAVPELSLIDMNGTPVNTADYKGKVVLVNFWAAWCTPCAAEVPEFIALQNKYRDQGLQVVGFSVDDDAQELHDFYRKHKMNYPVIPSDVKVADVYGGVLGLPTTIVVGRDSRIHQRHIGATDFALIEQEVVALLHAPQS